MSVILSHNDQSIWNDKTLTYEGITEAISKNNPQTAEFIIKLVQLDPMPKSWFYVNNDNDDLENSKRIERTEAELYSNESTQAIEIINGALGTLCDKKKMKELMKSRYFAGSDSSSVQEMSISDNLNREFIKEIYAQLGMEQWKLIQDLDPKLLPPRLRMDAVLIDLYQDNSLFARTQLFEIIRHIPLRYGVWHGIKSIFRKSIENGDWEMFGVCAIRFEQESTKNKVFFSPHYSLNPESYVDSHHNKFYYTHISNSDVSKNSLRWLTRRAWMVMRDIARTEPDIYASVAVEVLREINDFNWYQVQKGWLLPHIFAKSLLEVEFSRKTVYINEPDDCEYYEDLDSRGYSELWSLDMAPILRLFETAQASEIRNYAIQMLKHDFEDSLTELPQDFINRVLACKTEEGVDLVYTWLSEYCGFTQDEYIDRGAHLIILSLLTSAFEVGSEDATIFATEYITNHAEELVDFIPVTDILWMLNNRGNYDELDALGYYLAQLPSYQSKFTIDEWGSLYQIIDSIYDKSEEDESMLEFAKDKIISYNQQTKDFSWFFTQFQNEEYTIPLCTDVLLRNESIREKEGFFDFIEEFLCTPSLHKYHQDIWTVMSEEDEECSFLDDFSPDAHRILFLGPIHEMYVEALGDTWNSFDLLGIDFVTMLIQSKSWKEDSWMDLLGKWSGSLKQAFRDELFNKPTRPIHCNERQNTPYGLEWTFVENVLYDHIRDADITDIGIEWIAEKIQDSHKDFDIIREIALEKLPLSAFGENATEAVISAFEESKRGSKYFDFLDSFLKNRFNPYRRFHPSEDLEELSPELALSKPSWETIQRLNNNSKSSLRTLGLFFTKYLIRDYALSVPLGFKQLKNLFLSPYADVRAFFLNCIQESQEEYGSIDFTADVYTAAELYPYLSHADFRIRDVAIQIISMYPQKFAKLEDLFSLSSSTDRRIRELIVSQLWNQYKDRSVTLHWKPFAQSRVPQSPSSRRPITVHTSIPKEKTNKATEWYIGNGLEEFNKESIQFANIQDFIRYVLFRLPPKMPLLSQSKRASEKVTAWKNKASLIEALSNVAIEKIQNESDTTCAESFLSIFEELLESESKTEREALLVAKTKLNKALSQNS